MYALFAQITRFRLWSRWTPVVRTARQPEPEGDGVAHQLMERAEARAGQNPRQAQELRRAAGAYLSVVR